jgi:hypothetical protein
MFMFTKKEMERVISGILMFFLAVFLGFVAENCREQTVVNN